MTLMPVKNSQITNLFLFLGDLINRPLVFLINKIKNYNHINKNYKLFFIFCRIVKKFLKVILDYNSNKFSYPIFIYVNITEVVGVTSCEIIFISIEMFRILSTLN